MKGHCTTSKGNVVALYQALRSYGVDPEPILLAGGVELSTLEENSRLSSEMMDKMMCLSLELTGDPAFGLRFVEFIQPTSYHALGVALLYSPNLRSFCQRLERYFAIITTLDDTRITEGNGLAYLSTNPLVSYSETLRRFHSDGWAAWIVKLIRQMYRSDFAPLKVALVWTPADELLPIYERVFLCPLEYSSPQGRVYLDPQILDEPLPTSNAELARQNDQVVTEFLARMDKADLPSQVRAKLIEYLPSGECDRERIAQALNMTVRTLHNKLDSDGTSYQHLLDETRQELAQEYIQKGEVSVSEIAYLLGFTDVSSFSRAFKRWTGMSPRNFRKSNI